MYWLFKFGLWAAGWREVQEEECKDLTFIFLEVYS